LAFLFRHVRCHSFDSIGLVAFSAAGAIHPGSSPGNVLAKKAPLLGLDASVAHEIAPQRGIRAMIRAIRGRRLTSGSAPRRDQAFEKFGLRSAP